MSDIQMQIWIFAAMLWRRRWHALGIAWLICMLGWPAVMLVPNKYEASTRIYVDTETLLAPLMKGMTVDVNVNQQIEVMQRTLLSRPNLDSVLRATDLDLQASTPLKREALITSLRENTDIKSQTRNLFTVSFTDRDPALAKRVTQSLLNIFVESNLGASRKDMAQARRFIDGQVQQYEGQLREMEGRLATFKREHVAYFSGGEISNNAATLADARKALSQVRVDLEDAQTREVTLNKQLATVPQFLDVDSGPAVIIDGGKRLSPADQRVADAQNNLDSLRLRFTDKHPDVIAAERQLRDLKADAANAVKEPGRRGNTRQRVSNPVYEQLRVKAVDAELNLQMLKHRYAEQETTVKRLQDLASSAPEVEAQYINLDRDYQVLKKNYDEMLSRREAAKLSQEMDTKADKVQFRVIDPPQVPARPSSPNRPLLMTAVLVMAIGVGVVLTLGLGRLDGAVVSVPEMRQIFPFPTIGSISDIVLPSAQKRRRKWTAGFAAGCLVLFMAYGGIMVMLLRNLPIVS